MMQAFTNTALGEHADRAAPARLDLAAAASLLRARGYELVCRFDHVHAAAGTQEWHVCQIADLASMPPAHLMACLDEALALRVEPSIVRSPHI
jgi:hypothetical protein